MNLQEFQKIFREAGLILPEELARQIQIGVMALYEKMNYHKAIMFKTGFLATAIALKNYGDNHQQILNAFLMSYQEEQPPVFQLSWQFGENTVCMKLDQALNCSVTGEPCGYHQQKRYPLCELVHNSLLEAAKTIRKQV